MRVSPCLSLLLAFSLSAAADVVGSWTLYGISRVCTDAVDPPRDDARCDYKFSISESADPSAPRTQCTVWAFSQKNPATQISWDDYPCREDGPAAVYNISNGWDPKGFITITVLNHIVGAYAFFSFRDSELADKHVIEGKTELAYKYGTFGPGVGPRLVLPPMTGRRSVEEMRRGTRDDEPCDPNIWTVKNFSRNPRSIMQMVLLRFDLVRCDSGVHCKLEATGTDPTTVDIRYDNLSAVPCDEAKNILVSWGYKQDTDGGVMTLEDTNMHRRAFVGWDNVNGRIKFNETAEGKSEPV